jgi:polar amino acid transport system permease protein
LRAVVLYLTAFAVFIVVTNPNFQWHVVATYILKPEVLAGVRLSLILTFVAMFFGIALGLLLALLRMSRAFMLRGISVLFNWLFLSIPALVLLIFFYNIAALFPILSLRIPFGPALVSGKTNDIVTPIVAAVIGLACHEAAYMSEIIRSSVGSVEMGQGEAARALGMSRGTVFRRIILPQATRVMIPPTATRVVNMLKYTSLVSVMGLSDMLYTVQQIYAQNFQPIPLLLVACAWYLALTSVMMAGQYMLERRFARQFV